MFRNVRSSLFLLKLINSAAAAAAASLCLAPPLHATPRLLPFPHTQSPEIACGCILAHHMGLGKTLQTVAFLSAYARLHPQERFLVVVPKVGGLAGWQSRLCNRACTYMRADCTQLARQCLLIPLNAGSSLRFCQAPSFLAFPRACWATGTPSSTSGSPPCRAAARASARTRQAICECKPGCPWRLCFCTCSQRWALCS